MKEELEEISSDLPIVFRFMTVEHVDEVADLNSNRLFSPSQDLNTNFVVLVSPSKPIFNNGSSVKAFSAKQ